MGAFARIPQIGQSVATPQVGGAALLQVPRDTGTEDLVKSIGEEGQKLGRILEVQGMHQKIIDSDAAEEKWKTGMAGVMTEAQKLPGSQWATAIQQGGAKLSQQMLEDPANAHIAPYLKTRLPALQGVYDREAIQAGASQTAKDQDSQFKLMVGTAATRSATDFVKLPDGTIGDGPAATAARQGVLDKIEQAWPNNPAAVGSYMAEFDKAKMLQRGKAIAMTGDAGVLQTYLKTIDKAGGQLLTPDEISGLKSATIEAETLAHRQRDATYTMANEQALQYQDDYIKQHGHPDISQLSHDAQFKIVSPEDYRHYTGMDYELPTPAADIAAWRSRIAAISSDEDADRVHNDLATAGAFKTLNGRLVPELQGEVAQARKKMATPAKQATILAEQNLLNYYSTMTPEDQRLNARYEGQNIFGSAYKDAASRFKAGMLAHPDDPDYAWQLTEKIKAAVPKPSAESMKLPTRGRAPLGAETWDFISPKDRKTWYLSSSRSDQQAIDAWMKANGKTF